LSSACEATGRCHQAALSGPALGRRVTANDANERSNTMTAAAAPNNAHFQSVGAGCTAGRRRAFRIQDSRREGRPRQARAPALGLRWGTAKGHSTGAMARSSRRRLCLPAGSSFDAWGVLALSRGRLGAAARSPSNPTPIHSLNTNGFIRLIAVDGAMPHLHTLAGPVRPAFGLGVRRPLRDAGNYS